MRKCLTTITLALFLTGCSAEPKIGSVQDQIIDAPSKVSALHGQFNLPGPFSRTLQGVNDFVNSFDYQPDSDGVWKTPEQFFQDQGGDCEDFAVVKYHYLKNTHAVEILVGHLKNSHTEEGDPNYAHAVLLVDGKWVLDSMTNKLLSFRKYHENFRVFYSVTVSGLRLQDE